MCYLDVVVAGYGPVSQRAKGAFTIDVLRWQKGDVSIIPASKNTVSTWR